MQAIRPNPNFVEILEKIADNPVAQAKQFQIIPAQQQSYSLDPIITPVAVALTVFSLFSYRQSSKTLFATAVSLTALASYSAVGSKLIPNPSYESQVKRINELFDPCIQGLNGLREEKAKEICSKVNGVSCASLEEIKQKIKDAAVNFNERHDKSINQKSYDSVVRFAIKLASYDINQLPANDPVRDKFKDLQKAASWFMNGFKESESITNFEYVQYAFDGHKALIIL